MNVRGRRLRVLALLLVSVAIGLSSACKFLDDDNGLKYEFARNDAAYLYPVDFELEDVPERLDASGHFHTGRVPGESEANVYDIDLDNGCGMARVLFDSGVYTTLRVLGVQPSGACPEAAMPGSLTRAVPIEFIPRLDGTEPPRASTSQGAYAYPASTAPILEVSGFLRGIRS